MIQLEDKLPAFGDHTLSVRTTNVLLSASLFSPLLLSELTRKEAGKLHGCGRKTLDEFDTVLAAENLAFRRERTAKEALKNFVDIDHALTVETALDEAKQGLCLRIAALMRTVPELQLKKPLDKSPRSA